MKHSCRKTWESTVPRMASRQNGAKRSFLIQKDSKPQDFLVYIEGSVTKDQSGWGFTVKQGATTIHEDSTAYTVSSSSLTMEGEIVTHGHLLDCLKR